MIAWGTRIGYGNNPPWHTNSYGSRTYSGHCEMGQAAREVKDNIIIGFPMGHIPYINSCIWFLLSRLHLGFIWLDMAY
jgi:hypothetical protein